MAEGVVSDVRVRGVLDPDYLKPCTPEKPFVVGVRQGPAMHADHESKSFLARQGSHLEK